jgi:glycyl-tRNA synthetase
MHAYPIDTAGDPTNEDLWSSALGSPEEAEEQFEKEREKWIRKQRRSVESHASLFSELKEDLRQFVPCPSCKKRPALTAPRQFNLMFPTKVGALDDDSSVAYLRPETAQGIFANFKNVLDTSRVKLPFGIAQVGKSFRNEITPRNFIFRSREFEQMEIEFFCHPDQSEGWYAYWRKARFDWYVRHGLRSDRLRLRDHDPDELAFYSKATADIEYAFPFGVSELEGIAHRSDYDLKQHQAHSGKDLSYFDEESKSRFLPHVIEPSAGADRATLAFLCEAFVEDEMGGESRTVLKFHPRLAPIKAAIFPLVKKDGMPEKAEGLYRELKKRYNVFYDEKGAIGRRYRRQDEAGTPYCITVDGQTAEDGTVTFRDRDDGRQWRVPLDGAARALQELVEGR